MLTTDRLILRRWRAADRAPFAALNRDPEFADPAAGPLSRAASDALIRSFEADWRECGYSFAAVERKAGGAFIGMVGIARCAIDAPIRPCVEIGWRLQRAQWGRGYATEAARAWIAYGLGTVGLPEIVAFTDCGNHRSLAVMRRIGMRHDPSRDFRWPGLPQEHPLSRHELHAITRAEWLAGPR